MAAQVCVGRARVCFKGCSVGIKQPSVRKHNSVKMKNNTGGITARQTSTLSPADIFKDFL